jgi:hypothetical protein
VTRPADASPSTASPRATATVSALLAALLVAAGAGPVPSPRPVDRLAATTEVLHVIYLAPHARDPDRGPGRWTRTPIPFPH